MKVTPENKPKDKRNKVSTAIGKSLKAFRIAADKSQETLGFEAEVDRTYVSQIERGVANPSVITLANLCYPLNITLADLFASVPLSLKAEGGDRRTKKVHPSLRPRETRLR